MAAPVFVVVPAYNEGAARPATLRTLVAAGYSVVVVDDGSKEEVAPALAELPVHLLRHPINLGQGAALQTGTTYALAQGAAIIVHFDADGQHSADDIPRLVEPLLAGQADVALGSRFLRPDDAHLVPRARRWLLKCGVIINGLLTGVWLSDAHNGMRALSRRAALEIELCENRQAHASEILVQIRRAKLRWVERPTRIEYSAYSRAKGQSPWNAVNIVFDVLLRKIFR
jgi:glycosyltransferase involved in cell wall biosynthesis